jgi:hypothetical protein
MGKFGRNGYWLLFPHGLWHNQEFGLIVRIHIVYVAV